MVTQLLKSFFFNFNYYIQYLAPTTAAIPMIRDAFEVNEVLLHYLTSTNSLCLLHRVAIYSAFVIVMTLGICVTTLELLLFNNGEAIALYDLLKL